MRKRKTSHGVKANPDAYLNFLAERKKIEQDRIKLSPKKGRNVEVGGSQIAYRVIDGEKRFEAEICIDNPKNYTFRIFAEAFGLEPCFQFESKGKPHLNNEDGRGLPFRQVLAPHFHRFNSDGETEAFQTDLLRQPIEKEKIISNHKLGLEHFCQEARLSCEHTAYPELVFKQPTMDLLLVDPLGGVSF